MVFLFYSFMDILKNVPAINNLYDRIFKESDFICDTIIISSVSLYDLERYLKFIFFTPQQFKDIIEYLIRNNQFSPQCQVNLMSNTASCFRQVDIKIHSIFLLILFFSELLKFNLNQKLLNVNHNIINIYLW